MNESFETDYNIIYSYLKKALPCFSCKTNNYLRIGYSQDNYNNIISIKCNNCSSMSSYSYYKFTKIIKNELLNQILPIWNNDNSNSFPSLLKNRDYS